VVLFSSGARHLSLLYSIQIGSAIHPISYSVCSVHPFRGVKRTGREADSFAPSALQFSSFLIHPALGRSRYSDWLRAGRPRIRSLIPGRGKNFLNIFQTGSRAHPASYSLKMRKACRIPSECPRHLPRRPVVHLTHLFTLRRLGRKQNYNVTKTR
jgi:hypothetical protein